MKRRNNAAAARPIWISKALIEYTYRNVSARHHLVNNEYLFNILRDLDSQLVVSYLGVLADLNDARFFHESSIEAATLAKFEE